MSEREEQIRKIAATITKMFMNEGRIVEMGFRMFLLYAYNGPGEIPEGMMPKDMPREQYDMLRETFFTGAQHLFASIITGLDEDREPTSEDLKKMELIDSELKQFIKEQKKRYNL